MLADWLGRPASRNTDYRWQSLAHHLFEAGRHDELLRAIDPTFLEEKARRFGYGVLEDVELLARTMLAACDPAAVERCVAIVEGLRAAVGGDVIGEARWAIHPLHPGPAGFRSRDLRLRFAPRRRLG